MGLADVVESVQDREKTLTVFNPGQDDVVDELADFFADYNLEVREEITESGRPAGFVVLDVHGIVLTTTDLATLRRLLEEVPTGAYGLGVDDTPYEELLQHFAEATFTSYDRGRMLRATREIEDRAARVGVGRLDVGFQTADRLREELDRYRELLETDLTITCYVASGADVPELPGATVVQSDAADVRDFWVLAFDGGGEDHQQCALVGEQRSSSSFYGFWTYDPEIVGHVFEALPAGEGPSSGGGSR